MILDLDKFVMIIITYVMQPLKSAKVIGFKSRVNVARNVLALQVFMETSKNKKQLFRIFFTFPTQIKSCTNDGIGYTIN